MGLPASMAPDRTSSRPSPILAGEEEKLLERLMVLYQEEMRLYREVLEMSREQGRLIREGADFQGLKNVLDRKKGHLDLIGRLAMTERATRESWERDRASFRPENRRKLQHLLDGVSRLIADILAEEEANDLELIAQAGAV